MKILLSSIFCVLLVAPTVSFGCFAPKPEQVAVAEVLIKRTKDIYLAEAVQSSNGKIDFRVVERLKGKNRTAFSISGLLTDEASTDFKGHKLESFWSKSGGRGQIEPSCEIVPSFQKGKKYVIFLDKPYHVKSFELIESDSDTWLKKVRTEAKVK